MAPQRKRENRENNFYNVGVEGRRTGITLADKGVYDENGYEPISGIFSSPEKSPPRRGGTATASESMEIQESSIPELTTAHQILRNSRTHLPPPRSRSPKKTALGSSPRRQSSMAPRGSSIGPSSPARAASHPTARRLDFDQDETNLRETPVSGASGARRRKPSDVYDIPEDDSPVLEHTSYFEEGLVLEETSAIGDSVITNEYVEETFAEHVGEDTTNGAEEVEAIEDLVHLEQPEPSPASIKAPGKRGRKRKSDVLQPADEEETQPVKSRKRGPAPAEVSARQRKGKGKVTALAPPLQPRRSNRNSDGTELEPSIPDEPEQLDEEPVVPKRRGRPPRVQAVARKEPTASTTAAKNTSAKTKTDAVFKKPGKPPTKPKDKAEPKKKTPEAPAEETVAQADHVEAARLVNLHGQPYSKKDIEQMSTTSVGSRFGRGRHLSVFRELDPEAVARVGRTGRHRVAPIDFWRNDKILYDAKTGSMTSIVVQDPEEAPEPKAKQWKRGKKRALNMIDEEEEIDLEPWEEDEGKLTGNYRSYDSLADRLTEEVIEDTVAWAEKGIQPKEVPDGSFRYVKLSAVDNFFNWGLIELQVDQMKRSKNSRYMHMVWNVQSGIVEVKVAENEFTIRRGGVWQVPRGTSYSIKNVGSGTARIFFAQAREEHESAE